MNYTILEFSWLNLFFLGLFVLISYLVITDDRFTFNRKLLFILLTLGLFSLSYYINRVPFDIIQELFWYSLVLNTSFIIHTLILDRLFHYCWKNHYQYLGFLISRISFTLSLTGLNYFCGELRAYLQFFVNEIPLSIYYDKNKGKNNFLTKYAYFYENYILTNILLKFTFDIMYNIIHYSTTLIRIICINFSIIFANYSLILLGKQKKDFNKYIIINYLLQFIVLLIISILIGMPRLYIIWFLQAIIESYKIINLDYYVLPYKKEFQELGFLGKIKYTYREYSTIGYLHFYYENKYKELEEIYEKPYHTFFMFDLCKFNFYIQAKTKYSRFWGLHSWGNLHNNKSYPIVSIYKFIKWEEMAIGYIESANQRFKRLSEDEEEERDKLKRIAEALYWVRLINKNQEFLLILIPDLIKKEDLPLSKDLIKQLKIYE